MELKETLNIIGMISNLIGTIILAISLNNVIKAINTSIKALEYSQTTNFNFEGMENHRLSANKKSTLYIMIGFGFIVMGFGFQIITYII